MNYLLKLSYLSLIHILEYMLKTTLIPRFGGKTSCDEIGLPVSATGGVVPCGATAIWEE